MSPSRRCPGAAVRCRWRRWRDKGVEPIDDPRSMAYGAFSSDEELEEFLVFFREQRNADLT